MAVISIILRSSLNQLYLLIGVTIKRVYKFVDVILGNLFRLSLTVLFNVLLDSLVFPLQYPDVGLAYPLPFLERVNLIFQCILVLVKLDLGRDKSIEGQLRLIDEVLGDLVDIRVDLE